MNKTKRKRLKDGISYITKAIHIIESVKDEEEESLNSLPDNLADSNRALEMENNIDIMEEAYGILEEAISIISDISN